MQSVASSSINQTMSIVMSGITKVFVGEVTETGMTVSWSWWVRLGKVGGRWQAGGSGLEECIGKEECTWKSDLGKGKRVGRHLDSLARTVMDEWKETGPIRPRHMREAFRRLKEKGLVPYPSVWTFARSCCVKDEE
jgi:hTAFII28-like protein conserved region